MRKSIVFRIQAERSRAAAMKVLGKVSGLLGSDRYSVYDSWPTHEHQLCWAHLARLWGSPRRPRGLHHARHLDRQERTPIATDATL